jgi:hypothetical protein
MIKSIVKNSWIVALALMTMLMSCDKEESLSTDSVENYVDEVVFNMQRAGNCGKFGCYEFVFPITIAFADGSETEVADYPSLREALKTYREANPDSERPTLGFPLEVMTEEGEVLSVASAEELATLRQECRRDFFATHGHRGHRFRGMSCFRLSYPVTIVFPDGSSTEAADRLDLKYFVRRWHADNPDAEERPSLQYPLTVIMEDGTTTTVDSKEALKELKDSCRQ